MLPPLEFTDGGMGPLSIPEDSKLPQDPAPDTPQDETEGEPQDPGSPEAESDDGR